MVLGAIRAEVNLEETFMFGSYLRVVQDDFVFKITFIADKAKLDHVLSGFLVAVSPGQPE